jgi:hypothetical protein
MIAVANQVLAATAGLLLAVLAIDIVSSLPRWGAWLAYGVWGCVGSSGLAVAVIWRDLPMPVALLLIVLTLLAWTKRRRLVWAAERGRPW